MRNKFNATCKHCGRTVLAGAGSTNLNESGRWVTIHDICPKPLTSYQQRYDDYDDELDNDFYHGMTSEDFNPNEGDK